ncbi:YunG family protein [Butyrivibrio sp. VCD2006]|uniref:YunG family protein n=1 Tax=Butyrivibrio sp. VCD2006 TaxID=1280664 RepID=UPI0003F52525|nr:hypothetical protein [Butyrivibrio sp. VCD2006]
MEREYKFFGSENATMAPISEGFEVIRDPRDLYDLLSEVWSRETCAPRMRDEWSKENITRGQCSITAFLAQDIFGGVVRGVELDDGNYHCYNIVDGTAFDLTSEQFGDEKLVYDVENNPEQLREVHFEKEEKHQRYLFLKKELEKRLNKLRLLRLIDRAAKGNIKAAGELADAYYTGKFGDTNHAKAKKWASYAAKHGDAKAQEILNSLK